MIIGDQRDAVPVAAIVVPTVAALGTVWITIVSGDGSGADGTSAAQRAGADSSGTQVASPGQEGGATLGGSGSPAAYLSLQGKRGAKTLAWIRPGDHLIGRHPESCDIQVPDTRKFRRVGRVHAKLVSDGPVTWVQGLHHYGTYVNDEVVSLPDRRQLEDLMRSRLGGDAAHGGCACSGSRSSPSG